MSKKCLSLDAITLQLFQICEKVKTGTFFISTNESLSCQIVLNEGVITAAAYNQQFGIAALEKLSSVESGRCSFSTNLLFPLPNTALIKDNQLAFKQLGYDEISLPSNEAEPETNAPTVIYRGQVLSKETNSQPPIKQPPLSTQKPQRMYRGQIVRD